MREAEVIRGEGFDPYRNLALEACLLEGESPGRVTLYLWQNQRTVVVGRNQDESRECDVAALEADGGHLARRLSGGGAVYHDLGNLNFTFLVPSAAFDEATQTEVVLRAVRSLGVDAARTGRNDLVADGRKFSGHAYYHSKGRSYHHGTLMVDVDPAPLGRYLRPSAAKLAAKGVGSVRSRVVNLVDLVPDISIVRLSDALVTALGDVYGLRPTERDLGSVDANRWQELEGRFSHKSWLRRGRRPLPIEREARFEWGEARLGLDLRDGRIEACALWTDGLDAERLELVPAALVGCAVGAGEVAGRLVERVGLEAGMARDIELLAAGGELPDEGGNHGL